MKLKSILTGLCSTFIVSYFVLPFQAFAYYEYQEHLLGDFNSDLVVDFFDVGCYNDTVVENDAELTINEYLDLTGDSQVDIFDELAARQISIGQTEETKRCECVDNGENYDLSEFDTPPIKEMRYCMPSQGDARLLGFYVDFPDCRYENEASIDEIRHIAFGNEDENQINYPFESISAFFKRASKGALNLSGDFFRYTAKYNKSVYEKNSDLLIIECLESFADKVDYTKFDANCDKTFDALLVSVPVEAGQEHWWPKTGAFSDFDYTVSGMSIGYNIVGNAEIYDKEIWAPFVSTYAHELCHCMGLPDYYLMYSEDAEGFHGPAGCDLMEVDTASDLDCFSKYMLGWYRKDQITYYDDEGSYTLKNAQSDDGNCLIIHSNSFKNDPFGEYFIAEYCTLDGNNSLLGKLDSDYYPIDSGVRVFHIYADVYDYSNVSIFKYENRSDFRRKSDKGVRLIRLVGDADGGEMLKAEDDGFNMISDDTSGFAWYDRFGREIISTGLEIVAENCENGEFTLVIQEK